MPRIYPDDRSARSRKKLWLDYSAKYKKINICTGTSTGHALPRVRSLAWSRLSRVPQYPVFIWYTRRFRGNRMAPCRPDVSTKGMVAAYATQPPKHGLLSGLYMAYGWDLMWKAQSSSALSRYWHITVSAKSRWPCQRTHVAGSRLVPVRYD